jgi:hypothetical protein
MLNGRARVMKLAAAAVVLACWGTSSHAQGPGWTANSTITKLIITATGGINVRLSPELVTCVSQSGYGSSYASVYPDHPGINRIEATLLAAYTTGTPVALYFNDNQCTVLEVTLGGM